MKKEPKGEIAEKLFKTSPSEVQIQKMEFVVTVLADLPSGLVKPCQQMLEEVDHLSADFFQDGTVRLKTTEPAELVIAGAIIGQFLKMLRPE